MPPTVLLLPLVLLFSAAGRADDFVCALPGPAAKAVQRAPERLAALVIFAQFSNEGAGTSAPSWAGDLFDADLPGSFAHFYREMSGGQLAIEGQVLPRR